MADIDSEGVKLEWLALLTLSLTRRSTVGGGLDLNGVGNLGEESSLPLKELVPAVVPEEKPFIFLWLPDSGILSGDLRVGVLGGCGRGGWF